jgi:hypothetical protein
LAVITTGPAILIFFWSSGEVMATDPAADGQFHESACEEYFSI